MPWLLNEDQAIVKKLSGIFVTDPNSPTGGREVPVIFKLPETELEDANRPFIGIEHIGWYPDPTRMHDGYVQLPYCPEDMPPWWNATVPIAQESFEPANSPYWTWFPIPYNFDYMITVTTRYFEYHSLPIMAALSQYNRIPPKYGFLDIPQDGTKRSMFLMGGPEQDYHKDGDDKHETTTVFHVRVCSELLLASVDSVVAYGGTLAQVKQINLDLSYYGQPITAGSEPVLTQEPAILSVGFGTQWNTG